MTESIYKKPVILDHFSMMPDRWETYLAKDYLEKINKLGKEMEEINRVYNTRIYIDASGIDTFQQGLFISEFKSRLKPYGKNDNTATDIAKQFLDTIKKDRCNQALNDTGHAKRMTDTVVKLLAKGAADTYIKGLQWVEDELNAKR